MYKRRGGREGGGGGSRTVCYGIVGSFDEWKTMATFDLRTIFKRGVSQRGMRSDLHIIPIFFDIYCTTIGVNSPHGVFSKRSKNRILASVNPLVRSFVRPRVVLGPFRRPTIIRRNIVSVTFLTIELDRPITKFDE